MRAFSAMIAFMLLSVSASPHPQSPTPGSVVLPPGCPSPNVFTLHPGGHATKCLDVRGAIYADGTPVQVYDCNGTGAQKWIVSLFAGRTQIRLAETNFCLDAGSSPSDGAGMKIWTCYDNLVAQTWQQILDVGRYVLESDLGLCLDLTNGDYTNGNVIQTWSCTEPNGNQGWVRSPVW